MSDCGSRSQPESSSAQAPCLAAERQQGCAGQNILDKLNGSAQSLRDISDGLTLSQRAALGTGAPPQIWHPSYKHLHAPAPQGIVQSDDKEQQYDEYVNMGRRRPNADGTGRFKVTQRQRTLWVLPIPSAHHSVKQRAELQSHADALATLLAAYTTLPCMVSERELRLRRAGNTSHAATAKDAEQGCAFPLRTCAAADGSNGASSASVPPVDVFAVFDVLVEYAEKNAYALVAVMDAEVGESDGEGGWLGSHMGRACGDRVAVVTTGACSIGSADMLELYVTVLHELMHTFGLDHCTEWQCLMNSAAGTEPWPFLAPHNLRKLQLAVNGEDEDSVAAD